MQKLLVVGIGLALSVGGCHQHTATVWPKSAGDVAVPDWKEDGGQSLEPHSSVATDIEQSEGSSSVSSVAATSGDAASKSATATPTTPGKAEVIFLDDITIDMTAP
jgi:hypothetical protein